MSASNQPEQPEVVVVTGAGVGRATVRASPPGERASDYWREAGMDGRRPRSKWRRGPLPGPRTTISANCAWACSRWWANKIAPGLADRYLARTGYDSQQTDEPRDPNAPHNLWEPVPGDPGAHGTFDRRAKGKSINL